MYYIGNAVTDIGNVKTVNQDSLTLKIANTDMGLVVFTVICDGLGGLEQGEVASASVIRAFEQWFLEVFPYATERWDREHIEESWRRLLTSINQEICEYGRERNVEIGTTVTAVLFLENKYYVLHVGDCRLYEIKEGVTQVTRDQTVVGREVEAGILTAEQAKTDSRRNVLLQCVGLSENVFPDFSEGEIQEECSYLLCSDGFRHEITEEELKTYAGADANQTPEAIKQNLTYLVELNKKRGERDNISAILIRTGK